MERLKDKIAIVKGTAGGIGTALAHGLATEDARVFIAKQHEELCDGCKRTVEHARA